MPSQEVSVAIIERGNAILFIREVGNGKWSLPGEVAGRGEGPGATLGRALGEKFIGLQHDPPQIFHRLESTEANPRNVNTANNEMSFLAHTKNTTAG